MKKAVSFIMCMVFSVMAVGCSASPDTQKKNESTSQFPNTGSSEASSISAGASKAEKNSSAEEVSKEEPDQKDYTKEEAEGGITDDGLLVVNQDYHWRAMEMFGGGSGDTYVSSLNKLRDSLDDSVRIYSMPAPLACEFYTPSNFSDVYFSQAECFADIAKRLDKGITTVDICSVLKKHTEEHIYSRTDHHWQPLGAYYAARTLAKAAGVPFDDISKYKKVTDEGYIGSLGAMYEDERLKNDPEKFTYYEPQGKISTYYYDQQFEYIYEGSLLVPVDISNSYIRFISGDSYAVKVKTGIKNGRKLLVIKDSFGNAEIPFYTSSFEEIYVADMRYFERNIVNFVNDMGITDVLFTMAAYSVVGVNADNIETLITQDKDSRITDGQLQESSKE